MTIRFSNILKIQDKLVQVRSIRKKIKPVYYPGGEQSSVDQLTYQRSTKELENLDNEIYNLKKTVSDMPKEDNEDDRNLKLRLSSSIISGKRSQKYVLEKLNSTEGWGRNNLEVQQSEFATEIAHAEMLLSLL